ncbi:UNVERIFIED_CONTAM: hypothetical protein K2H54_051648 [Gekko kuhli]
MTDDGESGADDVQESSSPAALGQQGEREASSPVPPGQFHANAAGAPPQSPSLPLQAPLGLARKAGLAGHGLGDTLPPASKKELHQGALRQQHAHRHRHRRGGTGIGSHEPGSGEHQ